MNSGQGGVGIPVNVGGPGTVNSGIQGGAVNVPQKVNNINNNNADTNNRPVMKPATMTNNENASSSSPKSTNITNNIHNNTIYNNNNNNTVNVINNTTNTNVNATVSKNLSPAEIQQRQKLLMQQRALQQQQAMQNFENQFFQLLMTLNKKPKRIYNFVEETDLILQKYEQYRPSFEFHIYEDKFKICAPSNSRFQQQQQADNNQTSSFDTNSKNSHINQKTNIAQHDGLILEKDNETLKEFLEYVARGRIPEAIMEVLRDSNIQFYESNLILQVYDHTNTVEVTINRPMNKDSVNNSLSNKVQGSDLSIQGQNQQTPNGQIRKFRRPRVYRTLLRPNDLTNYYDMMTYADQARFSDSIYQQFESEILTLTKRNIKLDVDLNPFEHREKIDEDEFCEPRFNEKAKTMEFVHRKESTEDGTKGKVGHIPEHEEVSQYMSKYEQLMLIMSERTSTITKSTLATSLADVSKKSNNDTTSNNNNNNSGVDNSRHSSLLGSSIPGSTPSGVKSPGLDTNSIGTNASNMTTTAALNKTKCTTKSTGEKSSNENARFSRLKFIEQWKINVEKRKQQMVLNNNNNATNGITDSLVPGTPFITKISMTVPMTPQAQLLQQQQQFQQFQQQQQQQQQQSAQTKEKKSTGKGTKRGTNNTNDKPKAKRTKKTKKDTDGTEQTPKRKRVSKKKQAAADSSNNITATSPSSQPSSNIDTPI